MQMTMGRVIAAVLVTAVIGPFVQAADDDHQLRSFKHTALAEDYYSEGVAVGDVDGDGHMDVNHGPFVYFGPDYKRSIEIYPAEVQPRARYTKHFFSWLHDFNGDQRPDILTVGFPGTPAYVYENPGKEVSGDWKQHQVLDQVCNESPHLVNLVGDERPELVCTRGGYFGYAETDGKLGAGDWKFHPISEKTAPVPFGHGLGVGDVNGDGRQDVVQKDGWYEQPESLDGDPLWTFHKYEFAGPGGAEMHVYDVDGDGLNDVITSIHAHEYGLAWYKQMRDGEKITFKPNLIMGSKPEENAYGLNISEMHSVALADMDGDGLKDIVTGKTYWSHHTKSPDWDAGAVVYWFQLQRGTKGEVSWVPHKADGEAGIGRQIVVSDINADGLADIAVGGMKGCTLLTQVAKHTDHASADAAQPMPRRDMKAGLSPQEAAEHMTVPNGYRVQLAAGEPQVHQPVAMATDARGRLWVAEAHTYPKRAPEGQGKDKIIILEDTDGDGTLDKQTVFIDGLNLVSGLEVGFGGVWVGAAPYLLFIPDKDGDDRPDGEPQVLLDGWGYEDTHETINGFNWGPDGWLYGTHGVFTFSNVGKPDTPDDQRTPINAGVWRYHPLRHEFEVFAWGTSNPWGIDFNDQGQAFISACVIPHLYHVIQGGRYQRQAGQHYDPYLFDDIKTIADHAHYAGNIRDHAWWGGRDEPTEENATLAAGGGHAHCGAMIYLGDNWPEEERNRIFMNNVHGNRVNSDILERAGSGFVGKHGPDIVKANDHWFRGINLRYGPDGSVWLIDWYDPNACHRTTPEIWDRTNGRVFRIVYGDQKPVQVNLNNKSSAELVALHTHRNDWYVRTARRLLQERGKLGEPERAQLEAMLAEDQPENLRLRALWTLQATDGVTDELALRLLASQHEFVRAWAVQLALEDRKASSPLLAKMADLAKTEPSSVVRLYLASALQRLPIDQRAPIIAGLVSHAEDASDHNLPLMIWYGAEPLVAADPASAIEIAQQSQIPQIKLFIIRRAATQSAALPHVIGQLDATNDADGQKLILKELLAGLKGHAGTSPPPAWNDAYRKLEASADKEVRELADDLAVTLGDHRIFVKLRATLADKTASIEHRKRALEVLILGRDAEAAPALQAALAEPALRAQTIQALAAHDQPEIAPAILKLYAELPAEEKQLAIQTLIARPANAAALLEAIATEKVPRTDLHAYHVQQLWQFNDEKLQTRLREVWGEIRKTSADKQQQIAKLKSQLGRNVMEDADSGHGRQVFTKTCATCHTLFGSGEKIGPDLTGSNRANIDYVLENMVDPSAVVGKDYQTTVIVTVDGRVISGLVERETESAVTIRTLTESVVIPKDDIDERTLSTASMMPEQQLETLKPDQIRDLVAYLASPAQVPLRGPAAPIDEKSKVVAGAHEGETIKVLGKSAGEVREQGMNSFAADHWSGSSQLWWTGAKPGDTLDLELPVEKSGVYELEVVLTRAHDYGVVQLLLDDEPLGEPIDLYEAKMVRTTGVLKWDGRKLDGGPHRLQVKIVGRHPQADPEHMFGLDYVRLAPVEVAAAGAGN
ncbi:MAG: PVC-type heme-binding CxxCH protein [Pirellulales bacterium]